MAEKTKPETLRFTVNQFAHDPIKRQVVVVLTDTTGGSLSVYAPALEGGGGSVDDIRRAVQRVFDDAKLALDAI